MNEYIGLIWYIGILIGAITVVLHIIFALAVYFDVTRLENEKRLKPALVPALVWVIATLILGPLLGIGYWIINRSSIAKNEPKDASDFEIENYLAS